MPNFIQALGVITINVKMDNESWIIDYGDEVITKKSTEGIDKLTAKEKLVYCFWVADYSMRNAGDLQSAFDLYPEFQNEGLRLAQTAELKQSIELFENTTEGFESQFFDLFESVCNELKNYT